MPNAPWVICRWHIPEEEIKVAFVTAFNKLVTERAGANVASRSCASTSASCASEEIAANARLIRQTLCDTTELEREKASLGQESLKGLAKASLAVLVEMTQNCIAENARIAQDQGEYQKRYNGLVERYERAKARFDEVTEAIAERLAKGERLGRDSSGHLRRRWSLRVQKRRILRLPRTSTSVCVGGGVRQPALGKYGGVCHGGSE